jgi:hypothetical protein
VLTLPKDDYEMLFLFKNDKTENFTTEKFIIVGFRFDDENLN